MADRDPATGQFEPGNKFWRNRSSHGRAPKFETADDLLAAAEEYFDWCDDNPLQEAKIASEAGVPKVMALDKRRAMTIKGLCLFLDISEETWRRWKIAGDDIYKPHLVEAMARIEAVIYQWKFEGAAAGLLDQSIIARELGLVDKKQLGNDPDNPLPAQQVTIFALPDNGRD